ncbi:glycosyltransferase family A protein [Ramlibacter sp. AN1015]|uniref:glycosyltransferase family 2 protein n=1 Tax=Ramlibacter sp. AN1015 TaxID=3133428 RepID=UPI0030C4BD2A
MFLSVILPCYNGGATIGVQLEALCAQHWEEGWELIVVDNGSTDESMRIVERYRARLPTLRTLQAHVHGTPRLGVAHSYNTGLAAAAGDAFVFCEADDEVAPGWLHAMGTALGRHDFVAARLDHRKLNPHWLHPREGEGYQSAHLSRMSGYPYLAHASGCSFGLRRAVWERVGALEVRLPYVADTDYSWRAQLQGYSLHLVADALIHYRERHSARARMRQGRNWGGDYVRLLQRYGWQRPAGLPARRLLWLLRCLPRGAALLLGSALAEQHRQQFAEWAWSFGWSWGEFVASLDAPEPARSDLLALAQEHARVQGASAANPRPH